MHNTSHVADEPYPKLLQEKGFNGYPSLCFLDAEGRVVVRQVERTVAGFAKTAALLAERQSLQPKVKRGDGPGEKRLLLIEMELGLLTPEQIQEGARKLTLSKEEQARVDETLTDLELKDIFARNGKEHDKVMEQVAALAAAGRRPSKAQGVLFWVTALEHAAAVKDAKLAEQSYGELEKLAEGNEAYRRRMAQMQALVERAKEK